MPPINGQFTITPTKDSITLRAHTTIEQIEFEAAAVRACFDVVNQPGFLQATKAMQAEVVNLQKKIEDVVGKLDEAPQDNRNSGARTFRFAVDGTFAGLRVHCVAPALESKDTYADLVFGFGATALQLHNETGGFPTGA